MPQFDALKEYPDGKRQCADPSMLNSENILRAILESSLDVAYRRNLQTGCYDYLSPVCEQVFGFTTEEMRAMSMEQLWSRIHPEDQQALDQELRRAEETGRGRLEYRFQGKNGRYRWLADYITVLVDEAGRPLYRGGIVRDITERKEVERSLRELNETLEQRVAERTMIAEERARQLQALAVELTEAEERERRRIADLLHDDLQQILASIRLQLQAAVGSLPGTVPLRQVFQQVDALLEESIRKSRRLSHELSPPVLHHSGLADALEWLARQMQEQYGLEVQLEMEDWEDGEAEPLKILLFRAVQELLFNVVKHAGAGRAGLRLAGRGHRFEVVVRDHGRGFDLSLLSSAKRGKTGFGLFSIQERIGSVGGELRMASAPGQGSRFTLTFPRQPRAVQAAGGERPLRPETGRTSLRPRRLPRQEGYRVLVVDDHRLLRQGLIAMIQDQPDIRVVGEAANGLEALELSRELHPNVIIMDVSMSEMDGIEATRRILEEAPGTRIIGLSMHDEEEVTRQMLQAGAMMFLSKTESAGKILQAIYGLGGSP